MMLIASILMLLLQDPTRIEGVVLDAATSRPIPGARLFIPAIYAPRGPDTGPGMPPLLRPAINATTGPDGKFTLNAPDAGPHVIVATMPRYEGWSTTLSQEEVRAKVNVVFRLAPFERGGIVTGRALDPSGSPLAGVDVQLMQYQYNSHASLGGMIEHPTLQGIDMYVPGIPPGWVPTRLTASGGQTNDRGEYRFIDVPPGKYFVRVPSPTPLGPISPQLPPLSPIGAMYYPGVEGVAKAEQIEVRAGEELRLRDIVLARTTLQPIRATLAGNPVRPFLNLHGGPASNEASATYGLDNGVPVVRPDEPGNYAICAGEACVDIVYAGAAMNVVVPVRTRTAFFTGRVLLDEEPAVPVAGVTIGVVGIGGGANFGAMSGPDGFFKSPAPVRDGPAKPNFLEAPDGFYISSIRQGARDVLTQGVLIEGADTNLDVRVVKSSNTLRGRVLDGDRATIVLIPQGDLALRQDKNSTHRFKTTNLNGTFEIRNIIPGTYRAYALTKIQDGAYLDVAVFKPFEAQSTLVEIPRNGNVSTELKVIQ
jgi:hypothetical protein